jgi:hypothetical protein
MGGAYPYMDLNAKYEKRYYDVLLRLIQIKISLVNFKQNYYKSYLPFNLITGSISLDPINKKPVKVLFSQTFEYQLIPIGKHLLLADLPLILV